MRYLLTDSECIRAVPPVSTITVKHKPRVRVKIICLFLHYFRDHRSVVTNTSTQSNSSSRPNNEFLRLGNESKLIEEHNLFRLQENQTLNLRAFHQELDRVQGITHNPKNLIYPATPSSNWSSSFLKTANPQLNQELYGKHLSLNQSGWQSEFLQLQNSSSPGHLLPSSHHGSASASGLHRPLISRVSHPTRLFSMQNPTFRSHTTSEGLEGCQITQNSTQIDTAWDSAFSSVDNNLSSFSANEFNIPNPIGQTIPENQSTQTLRSSSPDALARTAASLIEVVDMRQRAEHQPDLSQHEAEVTSHKFTTDKFNNSGFMDFMRKLRDGEVKVEGDRVVEQSGTITSDAEKRLTGEGRELGTAGRLSVGAGGVWANDYAQKIPDSEFQELSSRNGINSYVPKSFLQARSLDVEGGTALAIEKELEMAKLDLEDRMKEMNDTFQESDAELERERYRTEMNKFQGDGGSVGLDIDEILGAADEVGRPELQNWTTTQVPGSSESWTERIEESTRLEDDLGFDESGMFGRPLSISEIEVERIRRIHKSLSAQQREWEKLQEDWEQGLDQAGGYQDAYIELLPQIRQLSSETGYDFQTINPYFLFQNLPRSSHHHSFNEQHTARSPGSVHHSTLGLLQKEAEVLTRPGSAVAWLELGIKQQENEREDMAIQALKKAIELDPNLSDAILALSISYTNENSRQEALEEIAKWIEVEKSRVPKYRSALSTGGNDTSNQEAFTNGTASQLNPVHEVLTDNLIQLARLGGRSEGSASVDADVQIALGILFNLNGEFEKASDCFGAALSVRPEDPLLFNRLGATLANSGKPDQAIEHYYKALEILPTYIRARYNLSISLINLGYYQESAENLLSALEMQTSDSSIQSKVMNSIGAKAYQEIMNNQESSRGGGVTSDVLWKTLEVNCSLLGRSDLSKFFETRDLISLRKSFSN
ncbi:hypothetical protein PPACK8108_LOCUS5598 [Phakopsora pachyrhizi]|uniref:Peroxisomal targeting signal receptor n=1 Tax=Phakopsora pachyrhizi TaxID=170000 RepID=A0AAV0AP95_PHAPC|nr:hypothetical protein PPACK8108_LOCUS5598 [Phakopsora pachyrhizi]